MSTELTLLHELASAYGVQTEYDDVRGQRQSASAETLLAVLAALDAPVRSITDVPDALAQRRQELAQQVVPPVLVAWDELLTLPNVRLPAGVDPRELRFEMDYEDGSRESLTPRHPRVPCPIGYHRLRTRIRDVEHETFVISAPSRTFGGAAGPERRTWGLFVPLYALRSEQSWGAGGFTELETLWQWTVASGGSLVATLPILAAFLDDPCDPSPYTPASRLFWNEFFVDPRRTAEFEHSAFARDLAASPEFQAEAAILRSDPRVDYRRQMALQRRVLERLATFCYERGGERLAALRAFVAQHPRLEDYARFRAMVEKHGRWSTWPARQRDGDLRPEDVEPTAQRYHEYVQWIAHEQLHRLIDRVGRQETGLYLDLPLGSHRDGYDTWRERDAYALGASGGAPPDAFFTKGQNWGFPPLHPERLRRQRYRHLIEYLRHHLKHAGMLRIDHVMQLHRLYWVPEGLDARSGAYVTYPVNELCAIVCLESQRQRCAIVGENLGTVPPQVNEAMRRHGLREMYVAQYELNASGDQCLTPVPRHCVASVNTHDMPTFAAYWDAREVQDLQALGLFDDADAQAERTKRERIRENVAPGAPAADALRKVHRLLAASPAEIVLVNLEDLWGETEPQNTPGTSWERPNWQRKLRYTVEAIPTLPAVREQLAEVRGERAGPGHVH